MILLLCVFKAHDVGDRGTLFLGHWWREAEIFWDLGVLVLFGLVGDVEV